MDQDVESAARERNDRGPKPPPVTICKTPQRTRQVRPKSRGGNDEGDEAHRGNSSEARACLHEAATQWKGTAGGQETAEPQGRRPGRTPYPQGTGRSGGREVRDGTHGRTGQEADGGQSGHGRRETQTEDEEEDVGWRWDGRGDGPRLRMRTIGCQPLSLYLSLKLMELTLSRYLPALKEFPEKTSELADFDMGKIKWYFNKQYEHATSILPSSLYVHTPVRFLVPVEETILHRIKIWLGTNFVHPFNAANGFLPRVPNLNMSELYGAP